MTEFLFFSSVLLLVYTFIGYPCILFLIGKVVGGRFNYLDVEYLPSVDIILVVRNAEYMIEEKIQSILALDYPPDKLSIIIISDSSTDSTVNKIRDLVHPNIRYIENTVKTSKSACLNQAIGIARSELLFLMDVRQLLDPMALKKLVRHFSRPDVGAVSGELVFRTDNASEFAQGIDAYWHYEKFIRRNESKIGSVPGVTGAIYVMRRTDFSPIADGTLLDDVLIPMNIILAGKRVLFEPAAIAYDTPSMDAVIEQRRKTRTLAGNWQILALQPSILNPFKNRIWLQYMSHKVLRLFCPLFLVIIFLSSCFLSSTSYFYGIAFGSQVAVYIVLGLASIFPILMRIKVLRIAYSFMMLMLYTVLGFWVFATRRHLSIWQ